MFVVRIKGLGRIVVGYAEIAVGRLCRFVRSRMHGHARVPNEQREEDGKTNVVCSESHVFSDQRPSGMFR